MIGSDQSKNPYAIVRKEQWSEDCNGIHIVHTKSYDAKGRVVGISTIHYRDGVNIGHFAEYVQSDGYWHGGAYDEQAGIGCLTYHPFKESIVKVCARRIVSLIQQFRFLLNKLFFS